MFKVWCAAATPKVPFRIKYLKGDFVPRPRGNSARPPRPRAQNALPAKNGIFLLREARRLGRELLVLGFRRQGFVDLGVVDDFAQELLAERCQRTLPQLARGF